MDPQTAKYSISDKVHLANVVKGESIKYISSREKGQHKKAVVVITKCLSDPCPRLYTDCISESVLIQCKDPKHLADDEQQNEGKRT